MHKKAITATTEIKAPIEKVWKFWTQPEHITQWCAASDDWHAPHAENDLKVGGKFKTRMSAKDGRHILTDTVFGSCGSSNEEPLIRNILAAVWAE